MVHFRMRFAQKAQGRPALPSVIDQAGTEDNELEDGNFDEEAVLTEGDEEFLKDAEQTPL